MGKTEFTRDLNGEGFIDWVSPVERVFDLKNVAANKVSFISVQLRGRSSARWDQLIITHIKSG